MVDLIDAEPDANGRVGACFTFTLPLKSEEETAEDAAVATTRKYVTGHASKPPAANEVNGRSDGRKSAEEPPVLAEEKT